MSTKKEYCIKILTLLRNIIVSVLLCYGWAFLEEEGISQCNSHFELSYVKVIVFLQCLGMLDLFIEWHGVLKKEIMSAIVICLVGYFVPLGIIWHNRQQELRNSIDGIYSVYQFQVRNLEGGFIFTIRYLMVVTVIILLIFFIGCAIISKMKKKHYVITGIVIILICNLVSYVYIKREQDVSLEKLQ